MARSIHIVWTMIVAGLLLSGTGSHAHNGAVAHASPAQNITVDGDLSDWPAESLSYPIRLQEIGAAPTSTADFEGRFHVAWDGPTGSLWIAVEIADDDIFLEGVAPTSLADLRQLFRRSGWRSATDVEAPNLPDGCAILIDVGHESDDSRTVRFGLDSRDTRTVFTSTERDDQTWRAADVATAFSEGHRVYEWRIDLHDEFLRETEMAAPVLQAGMVLGFDVTVADRDADHDLSWFSWGPGVGKIWGSRSQRRGDLVLIDAELAMGHLAGRARWSHDSILSPPGEIQIQHDGASTRWRIATDSVGIFNVDLPAGNYVLTLEDVRLGLDRLETTGSVHAGDTTRIDVVDDALFGLHTLRGEREGAINRRQVYPGKQRGVSWVGSRPIGRSHLESLRPLHANWIVQTPFGWQRDIHIPALEAPTGEAGLWGESDRGILVTTRLSQEIGIATLLKPHIWTGRGTWRGELAMTSEADWTTWFAQYEIFILHYARLAEAAGIEAFCIGTELSATLGREQQWRHIISRIREVYGGNLTYAANWNSFEAVPFWDAVDFIGVQAYFPLADKPNDDVEELVSGWQPWLDQLSKVSKREGRQVLFTEIGYRTNTNAVVEPWLWERQVDGGGDEEGRKVQAAAYEAFYRAAWHLPWVAGAYWWKWFPDHQRAGGLDDDGFTPQNKPAQQVIERWYLRAHLTESQNGDQNQFGQ